MDIFPTNGGSGYLGRRHSLRVGVGLSVYWYSSRMELGLGGAHKGI
jgi:hypothetical protein